MAPAYAPPCGRIATARRSFSQTRSSAGQNGGEDDSRIRTRMAQFLIAGVLSQDWSGSASVVHPFRLGESAIHSKQRPVRFKIFKGKHLMETALDWEAKRTASTNIQTGSIAEQAAVTVGRVRQILRLTRHHAEIQAAILSLPSQRAKKHFPERLLRKWITQARSLQFKAYAPSCCVRKK